MKIIIEGITSEHIFWTIIGLSAAISIARVRWSKASFGALLKRLLK